MSDDPSDYWFQKKVLYNRTKPNVLRKMGIRSQEEADFIVAVMGSGVTREDALYSVRKRRRGAHHEIASRRYSRR